MVNRVKPGFFFKDLLNSNIIYLGENHDDDTHLSNQTIIIKEIMQSGKPFQVAFENLPSSKQEIFDKQTHMHDIYSYLESKYKDAHHTIIPLVLASLAYDSRGITALGKPHVPGIAFSNDDMEKHMAEILQSKISLDVLTICLFGNSHIRRDGGIQRQVKLDGAKEKTVFQYSKEDGLPEGIFYLAPSHCKNQSYAVIGRL